MKSWIDVHAHWCLFGRSSEAVLDEVADLEAAGCEGLVVFPLPGMGREPPLVEQLLPQSYRDLIALTTTRAAHADLASWEPFREHWRERAKTLELYSFLDVRAWDGRGDLQPWWGAGHAGLKNVLVLEADADKMAMAPLRRGAGLTVAAYLEAHRAVFDAAARYGVPLVYHADLTHHGAFVEECLQAHPELPVNVPHCGFSRRVMAGLLERHPALVTDISSLAPYMRRDPASYRSFILDHPRRVLLGSDAIASHDLRQALEYRAVVQELGLPAAVEEAVLRGNARRFLGRPAEQGAPAAAG